MQRRYTELGGDESISVKRIRLGRIYAHTLTFPEALDAVAKLVEAGKDGYIVTPNVDPVVQAEHNEEMRAACRDASLSLIDGQPLIWLSRLMGEPFPEKISGSDVVPRFMRLAAQQRWRRQWDSLPLVC